MFGFFVGLLTAAALTMAARRGAFRYMGRRGAGGRPWRMNRLYERLGTDPEQEAELDAAFQDLRQAARTFRGDMGPWRSDLASLLERDDLDEAAINGHLSEKAERLESLKASMAKGMARVHATLRPAQRRTLAQFLGQRGRRCGAMA